MAFASLIRTHPLVYDRDRADDTMAELPWVSGPLRDLFEGVAGCSPYLAGLMIRESDWLKTAVTLPPDDVLPALFAELSPGPVKTVSVDLRRAKRRVALWTGLADCGGVWSLEQVTGALSCFADLAVDVATKSVLMPVLAAGKLPGQTMDDLPLCAGLTTLAMGKGGAMELNYSSDIDLICLFDDARYSDEDLGEARMVFSRVVRKAMALLSDLTGEGYVFRTDLRLRPDPSVTPVAVSMSAAERYYESLGRTWERAAFIKARPAAGDIPAAEQFLETIRPFIWRRHLDFATIEETQDMQARIRSEKNTWDDSCLDNRNLKLGPGGIREIEFFVQTRQLIAGGRDRSLRVRGTCEGLSLLTKAGWMPASAATALTEHYRNLRLWEHRAQMVQDAQTHHLPKTPENWDRMARFLGFADTEAFRQQLQDTLADVQDLTAPILLSKAQDDAPKAPSARVQEVTERWNSFAALRSERARAILSRLLPDLLARFDKAANPDDALTRFERFLGRLPAGVQVFSLFEANPQLIDLMVDIASTSAPLADYLSCNPQVLDAVIDGAFFAPWPGCDVLVDDLSEVMAAESDDYELRLDAARRWHKEWRFRIGVHHLRGLISARQAAVEYSDLAEAVVRGIWPVVLDVFAEKHGAAPGRGAAVLGMGSLGARALSFDSDLDLIVIYDAPEGAESDGRRPLAARTYFARLTKALITALSAPMAEGTLYEVDMRLRPSGRQGPVAASFTAFRNYQQSEAWVWEHLALTRARVVAGAADLGDSIESFRRDILGRPADRTRVLTELQEMRARLAEAKPQAHPWDFDDGPGGRKDIELVAAAGALVAGLWLGDPCEQLQVAPLDPAVVELIDIHDRFSAFKQTVRLLAAGRLDPETLGHGGRRMVLRDGAFKDLNAFQRSLQSDVERAKVVLRAILPQ